MTEVMFAIDGGLRDLLREAPNTVGIPERLSAKAKEYLNRDAIPFREAQEICSAVRAANGGDGPWLHNICKGTRIVLPSPPPITKSDELQERLDRLRKEQEEREYQRMVADITVHEREAEMLNDPGVKGYKESMGFGLNTIVTGLVFYLVFVEIGKRLSSDQGMQKMYGICGLFLSIVLQAALLIIRSSYSEGSLGRRRRNAVSQRWNGRGSSPSAPRWQQVQVPQEKKVQ